MGTAIFFDSRGLKAGDPAGSLHEKFAIPLLSSLEADLVPPGGQWPVASGQSFAVSAESVRQES